MGGISSVFYIHVAELLVKIDNHYDLIKQKCTPYLAAETGAPDLTVEIDEAYFALGEEILRREGWTGPAPEQAEAIGIHNKLYTLLAELGVIWLHSALVGMDGYGYAFTAPSGYGKTTHAKLWLKRFGARAQIVNGDCPLFRLKKDAVYAYGTPFCGKEGYQANTRVQLRGLCFLNHGERSAIRRMDPAVAYGQLLRQYAWWIRKDDKEIYVNLLEKLVERVPVYQLTCTMEEEAAQVAYEGMKNG